MSNLFSNPFSDFFFFYYCKYVCSMGEKNKTHTLDLVIFGQSTFL